MYCTCVFICFQSVSFIVLSAHCIIIYFRPADYDEELDDDDEDPSRDALDTVGFLKP